MKIGMPQFINNSLALENLVPFIVYVLLAILTLPLSIGFPRPELDSSYDIGLNLAFLDHLQFGKDIVFTYGPLGFLGYPLILDYNLWRLSLLFNIFVNLISVLSIYLLFRTLSAKWYHYLIFAPVIFFTLPFTDHILTILPITIFIYLIIISKGRIDRLPSFGLLFVGLLLAVVSLIKFDIFLASIYVIATSVILFIINKDIKTALYLLSSYILSLIALWIFAGQNLANIPGYIYSSIDVSKGYSGAMAIDGPFWQVQLGLISILVMVFFLIYSYKSNEKSLMIFLMANLFFLFSTFKLGFVRQDEHFFIYFPKAYSLVFGLILVFMLLKLERDKKNRNQIFLLVVLSIIMTSVLILSIYSGPMPSQDKDVLNKFSSFELTTEMLKNRTVFDDEVSTYKEKIRNNYSLDRGTINYIGNKTVDIFPWDVALPWAYGLNWSPRPMFQSVSAWTEYLDYTNSKHFTGGQSPQSILYAFESVDYRYPLFDEPETFRTVLNNYIFKNISEKFITLKHSSTKTENESEVSLGTTEANFGQFIPIPDYKTFKGFVFCYTNINYSPLGKILSLLYKPSPVYIQFKLEDGFVTDKFRLIPDNARNGLFVSEYAENIDDLSGIFQDKLIRSEVIKEIKIETESPDQYEDLIGLDFRGIPANISDSYPGEDVVRFIRLVQSVKLDNNERNPIATGHAVINGESRAVILQHPLPYVKRPITFENIVIPENAVLKFGLGLHPKVWSPDMGDGVTYEIYMKDNKSFEKIFSKYIDPKNNLSERKWNDFEINLSSYKDKKVSLILNTTGGPKNDCANDWAYWAEPKLIINGKAA